MTNAARSATSATQKVIAGLYNLVSFEHQRFDDYSYLQAFKAVVYRD